MTKLQRGLAYEFKDQALLQQALTHKSAGSPNNERLEFLGDAVIGYLVGYELYRAYPDVQEDVLSLMRSQLVRKETLAELASDLGVAECLYIGASEKRSGGRQRASTLADAFEAVLGAIHLDGGIDACERIVKALFSVPLKNLADRELRDPKTRLQELLQSQKLNLPDYQVDAIEGADHARRYTVSCSVPERAISTTGMGSSRREAEKAAALAMLGAIEGTS
ncbi:MAG: ribonuclease III [Pseudomonadota bacterium]